MNVKLNRPQTIMVAASILVLTVLATTTHAQWTGPDGSNNIYYNSGNVGIGTNAPAVKLHVESSSGTTFRLVSTGDNVAYHRIKGSTGDWYTGLFASADYSIGDITNSNATYLTIKRTSGNVGIGLTSPDSLLHVSGGAAMTSGWNRTANLQATFPTLVFNSASSKWAGLGYDYSAAFRIWVNATSNDVSGTGTLAFNILNSGFVGIGASSPDSQLHVSGGTAMSSGWNRTANLQATYPTLVFNSASSKWAGIGYDYSSAFRIWVNASSNDVSGTGTSALSILNSGYVGVGNNNPQYKLDVNGAINATGLNINGSPIASSQWSNGSGNINYLSGNVGIGTTSPNDKLSIEYSGPGGIVGAYVKNTGGTASGTLSRFSVGQTNSETSGLLFQFDHNDDSAVILNRKSSTGTLDVNTTGGGIRINNAGSVGIGTLSPANKLQVGLGTANNAVVASFGNDTRTDAIRLTIDSSSNGLIQLRQGSSGTTGALVNSAGDSYFNGGNLGIGTASPGTKLNIATASDQTFRIDNTTSTYLALMRVNGSAAQFGASNATSVQLLTNDVARLTVLPTSGNVGIGKTDPTVALDVVGDIKASGVIHAKYQDVAEWVESSEQLTAGTVVVLDQSKSNQVISSTQSYDTRVAGVVSSQPGITLGEKGDNKVLVATTGRVKVKVDATKSPIQIGDLLVTSDVPGVAMKSEPVELAGRKMHMPGTLIGKAIEPLAKGKGEILVLLSLQ